MNPISFKGNKNFDKVSWLGLNDFSQLVTLLTGGIYIWSVAIAQRPVLAIFVIIGAICNYVFFWWGKNMLDCNKEERGQTSLCEYWTTFLITVQSALS